MAKAKNDYFLLTSQQVEYCVMACDLLEELLEEFSAENVLTKKEKVHEIEHLADELHHVINTKLAGEFITPIDQEDILHLAQIIDDVTDAIDEVTLYFYMYSVEQLPEEALTLARTVSRCVKALHQAVGELKNFKKPEKLRRLLVEVNDIESEADEIYIHAIRKLFCSDADTRKLIGDRAIYESLDICCDQCELASDIIVQIIIKNT